MDKELEMRIMPSFCDENCTIIFSFYFKMEKQKIGEAVIYTCPEGYPGNDFNEDCTAMRGLKKKIAYIKQFEVIEEYKSKSFKNVTEFLRVLGIHDYIYNKAVIE